MQKIVRIIPAPAEYGEPSSCNGTKVLLSDGQELHGITGITIRGQAGDPWRAEIDVLARPDQIEGVVANIREAGGSARTVDGVIVIECQQHLTVEGEQRLKAEAESAWPHRTIVILPPGVSIHHDARLDGVEAKVDEILSKMARRPHYGGGPF